MLQIRLNKGTPAESIGGKSLPVETVTVACPDHLVLADLPVAKTVGSLTAGSIVKLVGRRSRRHLGERVHFCVRCDFPIAIYGRLSPCEHAFCLDCARSDSICYLCDERIQKIQTIKMMEGIFICAAPHCLKSFLKKIEFESHIHERHSELFQANEEREFDGNESEGQSFRQSEIKPLLPRQQIPILPRPPPPPRLSPLPILMKNHPSSDQPQPDTCPPGFEKAAPQSGFWQQQQYDTHISNRGFGSEQGSLLGLAPGPVLNLYKETMETQCSTWSN